MESKPVETQRGLPLLTPDDEADDQSRYLEAEVDGIRVACIYLPNGNPLPGPKFDYKLRWMERLRARMAHFWSLEIPCAVVGDYNVIPHDDDVWSPKRMEDDALMQPQSRDAYMRACWPMAGPTPCARSTRSGGVWTYLGLSGGRMAARSWLPHRSSMLLTPELADAMAGGRGRQGISGPRKSQRSYARLGRNHDLAAPLYR